MAGHTDREIVGTTAGAVDELEPELRATLYEAMLDLPENDRAHSRAERAIARRRRRLRRMRIGAAGLVGVAGVAGVIVAVGTRSDDVPSARPTALVSTQEHSRPAKTDVDDRPSSTATETPAAVTSETTPPGSSGTSPGRAGSRRRTARRALPAPGGSGPTAAAMPGTATEPSKPTSTRTSPTTTATAPPSTSSTTSPTTSTTTTTTTTSPPPEPPPEPPPIP